MSYVFGPNWDSAIDAFEKAPTGQNNLGELLDFLFFSIILYGIFGVLTIPKWLIKDSGHFPILFVSFLEVAKNQQKMDPQTPYSLQKYFKI